MPPPFGPKKTTLYDVPLHAEDSEKGVSYINLTILDASEAVHSMVKQKIQETQANKPGPASFKNHVADKVARAVASQVPASTITAKLSDKLPKMLMYQMHHKLNMKLAAQTVFVEDSYAVMQIQVQYVDATKLLAQAAVAETQDDDDDDSVATAVLDEWLQEQANLPIPPSSRVPSQLEIPSAESAGEPAKNWKEGLANWLEWVITKLLPDRAVRSLEHDRLPALVQSMITKNMRAMMEKKLTDKKLQADIAVLDSVSEARYFFSNLRAVRERAQAKIK